MFGKDFLLLRGRQFPRGRAIVLKQPEVNFKMTTTSEFAGEMLEIHSQFLNRASAAIGVTMYVELIETGAVFFYETVD
jgi:hypothetical protein